MNISVVIPAYNAASLLPRCLASVFAQSLVPTEVLVVDDGSTDSTSIVASELGATVIRRSNGGLSAARNTGISHAKGDWIALLDADDVWHSTKLASQADHVRRTTVLVYTGIRIVGPEGIRQVCTARDSTSARKALRYENSITPSTVLVRSTAFREVGGFREDIRACEDWEMWVRLAKIGSFEAVEAALTDYFVSSSSMSTDPKRMLLAMEQIMDTTLISDLHGFQRWAWSKRVRAVQLYSAALIARENGLKGEADYMLQSLRSWPSPLWQPRRFAGLAVTLLKSLRKNEASQ